MASLNKVQLIGHVGRDPEIRYLPSGQAVANFSIATTSKRKNKQTGETIEDTQWHRLTAFERLAEIVGEYVKKGSALYVEGRLKYGEFEKDGVKHHTTDIVVQELQMLGSRPDAGAPTAARRPAATAPGQQRPAPRPAAPAPAGGGSGFDDMDEEIPF